MRKVPPTVFAVLSCLLSHSLPVLQAEQQTLDTSPATPLSTSAPAPAATPPKNQAPFEPFTGKITKNKVRLRLQPSYEAPVIREFGRNDLVVIVGATEDFYALAPLPDTKGYVFRTYVLDNVVEGTRVNVRTKPDLEAPIIVQLNSGDRVEGTINPSNNKWLAIKLPASTRFYIAKEYVEKIGDAGLMARLEKRKEDVIRLLNTTEMMSRTELAKPFNQMNIDGIKANYQRILTDYTDFPETSAKAKELLAALQEAYTAKKIAFLESQAHQTSHNLESKNKQLADEVQAYKNKIVSLEQRIEKEKALPPPPAPVQVPVATQPVKKPAQLPLNMSFWLPIEEALFTSWAEQTGKSNPNLFYEEQKQQSFTLRGLIDPYNRPVKNKPGDYMLINSASKLPIAFLYSTQVNLQDYLGHEVTVRVTPRSNNHYAFPAYFVLSID